MRKKGLKYTDKYIFTCVNKRPFFRLRLNVQPNGMQWGK